MFACRVAPGNRLLQSRRASQFRSESGESARRMIFPQPWQGFSAFASSGSRVRASIVREMLSPLRLRACPGLNIRAARNQHSQAQRPRVSPTRRASPSSLVDDKGLEPPKARPSVWLSTPSLTASSRRGTSFTQPV